MNEGDTAGGQRGRNQALPAGTDRRVPNDNNAAQLPAGTQGLVTPMSRSFNENQQLEQQPQQPQQPPSSLHSPRQHHSQQMQSDGTSTPSSLSSASTSKSVPHQDQQDHQQSLLSTVGNSSSTSSSSSSSSNSHVNTATNVSGVQHPASSQGATASHSLQQQQQQQGVSFSGGSRTTAVIGTASVANNASVTSAAAGERTESATSSASGTSKGECATDSVVQTRSSGSSSAAAGRGAGGAESAVSTPIVDGGSCATVPAAGGSGASNSSSVVLGNTLVKTNSTLASSLTAAAVTAAGGQSTAVTTLVATGAIATSSASLATNTGSYKGSASPTASRKRVKLEAGADVENDVSALKKLILEHKYMRLRSIKERYSEHVAELFFLQTGGSMMEYPVWRKKPPTPAFTNFIRSYKLEPLSTNLEEAGEALKQQSTRAIREPAIGAQQSTRAIREPTIGAQQSTRAVGASGSTTIGNSISGSIAHQSGKGARESASSLPQGAEIKIPGVGVTPVAVSTTLPAAVAQLSQQGHVPGRPQGGRHGMVFGQISVQPPALGNPPQPLVPGGTPIVPDRIGVVGAGTTTTVDRKKHSSVGVGSVAKSELLEAVGSRVSGVGASQGVPTIGSNGPSSAGGSSSARVGVSGSTPTRLHGGTGGGSMVNSVQQQNGTAGYSNDGGSSGSASGHQQQQAGAGSSQSTSNNTNGPDQYTNKARQEVFVMQRVQELQKEGLWTEKRLPKVQEPARPRAHWDYLLEEMAWLSTDFAQERKWKKASARKCARMVQKYFQDKALAAQRAEKAQELQLKRIAAFVAKEIKTFWSNAEKLVEYKQQTKLDEKRKKALDQQLSFIVDQTEKYSQQLVEGMNKVTTAVPTAGTAGAPAGSKAESLNSSRISSPQRRGLTGSDEEFCPEAESSDDDEETIAKAEAEAEEGTKDEVAALQKESEMDLDDFLKHLPKDYLANRDKIVLSEPDEDEDDEEDDEDGETQASKSVAKASASGEEEDGDKDFSADEDSMDDEDTIKEQERKEKHQDHKKEIDELNADNEMSIDELMAKYKNPPPSDAQKMDLDSDDDEDGEEEVSERTRRKTRRQSRMVESSASADEEDEEEDNSEGLTGSDDELPTSDEDEMLDEDDEAMPTDEEEEEEDDGIGLKHLLDDETGASSSGVATGSIEQRATTADKSQSAKDEMLNDAAAIAESIQPKGNTLSSTSVVTPIPVLLKHSLREYQHIGLDWLVTMHDRKLNGILADEMGLGKTIQTISLLAHLACVKGNWGPHLIIVPSSVMLNWEMEFKKWCPGFKILTYYGTPKERKMKRTGWTKVNAFHVCITSYKLVIQDHQSFRRKKWKYLILDEAQNIKNFRSQRWQLLLNFQTEQRLLLTGTPLQNNLMELWSLMHFLMPHIFQSHREFKEWFSNPMTGMIEGNSEYSETIIKRLHKVLRPFLLRRLKSEVEKQMPKKYEHVIMCRLSKRQRFLYDDFMSRAKTRETLASGNLLSVINVLMQLRKVCNHPNMFEERPTISPFRMDGISFKTASLVYNMFNYDPFTQIDLSSLNLVLVQLELLLSAYVAHRSQRLCMPKRLIEEIDSTPLPPPRCPTGKLRLHVRIPDFRVQESLGGGRHRATGVSASGVRIGTSPAMKTEGTKFVPLVNDASSLDKKSLIISTIGGGNSRFIDIRRSSSSSSIMMLVDPSATSSSSSGAVGGMNNRSASPGNLLRKRCDIAGSGGVPSQQQNQSRLGTGQVVQIIPQVASQHQQQQGSGGANASASYIITGRLQSATTVASPAPGLQQRTLTMAGGKVLSMQRPVGVGGQSSLSASSSSALSSSLLASATGANRMVQNVGQQTQISSNLAATIMQELKHHSYSSRPTTGGVGGIGTTKAAGSRGTITNDAVERQRTEFYLARIEESRKERRSQVLEQLGRINAKRLDATPIYGRDLRETLCEMIEEEFHQPFADRVPLGVASAYYTRRATASRSACGSSLVVSCSSLVAAIKTIGQRAEELRYTINNFVIFVPAVCAPTPYLQVSHPYPSKLNAEQQWEATMAEQIRPAISLLHPIISAMSTQFPDPRLIQYDCGKLQTLDRLLKKLKSEGHRVLIFTQMTRMLDVLEAFLNYHGHIYLRLDGTTKVEQRQVLMERFNNDRRMFAFILSTRSGGVGINLTGADTVIFYDSDWNPTMDAQAQDRCHRIGQTRDVHIYRLVSEKTIEENILKKANQKRILGDLAIEGGNFTTAYFKSSTTVQDLFTVDAAEENASARLAEVLERDRERKERLNANLAATPSTATAAVAAAGSTTDVDSSKSAINVFESALAAAEDDQDVQAAKFAKAEASAGFDDLDEIDESGPADEDKAAAGVSVVGGSTTDAAGGSKQPELSKAEKEVQNLIKQLSPIERYAMRFVEDTEGTWTAVQLKAVEQEIEQQKREWEANRLAEQRRNEEAARQREAEEHADLLTFSREDAKNQIWISDSTMEKMPMWCPPTPPQDDNDLYVDHSLTFLYDTSDIIPEGELPPVYVKKDYKRSRSEAGFCPEGRRPPKIRREDTYYAPRSLFDRPTPQIAKMRKEYKLQRYKGIIKPFPPMLALKPPTAPMKPPVEPEGMPEWTVYEDMAILNVVQNLQGLPLNLMVISPGHTPNWDLVADIVNQTSRTYRLPKQCRYRYESVIMPREEGKLLESPKKQKKNKNPLKQGGNGNGGGSAGGGGGGSSSPTPLSAAGASPPKQIRSMRTGQLYTSDANSSFIKLMRQKFENIKTAFAKKPVPVKSSISSALPAVLKNPKHALVLAQNGITNYDTPQTPVDIAIRRAERMSKEKNKQTVAQEQQQQQQQQAQQQAQQQQQQQQAQAQQQQAQQQAQQQQQQQSQQVVQVVQASSAVPQTSAVVATMQKQQTQAQQATTVVGVQSMSTAAQQQQQQATGQAHVQTVVQQQHIVQQPSVATMQAVAVAQQQPLQQQSQHILQQQRQIQAQQVATSQQQQITSVSGGGGVQQATIVVCSVPTNATSTVASIVQASTLQAAARAGAGSVVNICANPNQSQVQQQHIVKAIVASPASQNLLSHQLAQVAAAQQNQGQVQQQQGGQQQQVSVVLTTPVTTMSGVNTVQLSSQPQIVSIHQPVSSQQQQQIALQTSSGAVTPVSQGTIVQTLASQSMPQVVSVAQLASSNTVTTIQPSQVAQVTSALRAQRIVAPPGTLHEVVLHQRSGSQSPTVVSLGGGLTQAQLQTAQLRLSMAGAQQVSGVVAKSISVGTVTTAGKPMNTPQIQFYRQQPIRQQLKVLHPGTATQVGGGTLQSGGPGQPTIVSPAILQGNIIQTGTVAGGGQKLVPGVVSSGQVTQVVSAAVNVSAGAGGTQQVVSQSPTLASAVGGGSTIATVQVGQGQPRMQYIKQLGGTKHMITRPVTENEMQLMVKRQIISQQQQQQQQAQQQQLGKQQLINQTQIFAPASLQVQQASAAAGTSAGQQIATLVKTSGGTAVAATGMTLSQVKPGQLKTISSQNQVRQLHLQQQILAQQRKGAAKMTHITQVTGKAGQPTQLFVQGPKNLAAGTTMTMQQIQQVIRHANPASLASGGQIVLGKTGVGRMIPVSVSQQPNQGQTIQVGNIRAQMPRQNIGTIKVAGGATSAQQQQVILNAIQSQQQAAAAAAAARSNASPVRLQTTSGGSLVAVTVQQPQQQLQQQMGVSGGGQSSVTVAATSSVATSLGVTVVEAVSQSSQTTAGGGTTVQSLIGGGGGGVPQVVTIQQQSTGGQQQQQQATQIITTGAAALVQSAANSAATGASASAEGLGSASSATNAAGSAPSSGIGTPGGNVVVTSATTGSAVGSQQQQQQTASSQQQVSMIKKKQSPNVAK